MDLHPVPHTERDSRLAWHALYYWVLHAYDLIGLVQMPTAWHLLFPGSSK